MRLPPLHLGLSLLYIGIAICHTRENAYDYIVVGGGPSGIITAERLAKANMKVLLLERGQGPTISTGATNPLDWNGTLTAVDIPALAPSLPTQYMCTDTPGAAACVLGGGVSINYLVFIHPPAHDFERWPRNWKWKDVAPAAQRLYARNPGTTLPSTDGQRYDQGLYSTLSQFFDNLGWESVDLIAQPDQKHNVYSYPLWNIEGSKRAGPVRTYLPTAQKYTGFKLRASTKALRLIRSGKRITGVEIKSDGKTEVVSLASNDSSCLWHKVPVEKDWIILPVGQNLKDHSIFTIVVETNGTWGVLDTASVLNGTDGSNIELFESCGSGVLTQGRHRAIFFTSKEGSDGITRYFQGSCAASAEVVITMTTYMTHGLTSSGVFGLQENGTGIFENPRTGFELQIDTNTSTILKSVRSGNHYTGTAKMGTDDGRCGGTSVVDTNTKVYGMDNVFVTDASIHPDLPTGNTQAIVMVVAEAAVDRILAYKE